MAIAKALATSGFIIGDDTGYGKTVMGIEVAKRSRTHPWRGLVVSPKKIRYQWESVIHDQDPGIRTLINDTVPYDYEPMVGWVIIGYHELLNSTVLKALTSVLWDIVIADEAHRIKNRKAKMTAAVKLLPRARSLAMTGSPIEKSPADLWSLLNFVHPDDFPTFWAYIRRWVITEQDYFEHWHFGGPKDPEEFGLMLSDYLIRRPLDLPYERVDVDTFVDMTPGQATLIDTIRKEKDVLIKIEDKELLIPNALALITRLQQIATDPGLLGFKATSGKFDWLKEFLDDHPGEPVIVFTRFRDVALWWGGRLDADIIVGNQGDGQRFIRGEKDVLIGTIDAMGEGIDGLQRARYAVFLDAHWSTIKTGQAFGRIYRTGIHETKVIYLLHSTREDKLVYDALEKKWSEAELVYYFLKEE